MCNTVIKSKLKAQSVSLLCLSLQKGVIQALNAINFKAF